MHKINKIYITSDPLMTKETEQFSNRRWLKDLLYRPIMRATGLSPQTLASSRSISEHINRRRFFSLSGIEVDLDVMQFWYDDKKITDQSLDYLSKFVSSDTLVIGYELSVQTRALFQRLNVPYIDIWLHPVRFLDDILFGFNSNLPKVRSRLFDFNLPEDQMYLYADRIRIQTYKGWRRKEAEVKPGSALFIGQMMNDKSVCLDGRMLNVLDFKERFEAIAAEHSMVYYARHPYLRSGDEEIMQYLDGLNCVELTDIPSYRLLASQRVEKVFGLSSSMIHEAKYFNKKVEFLFRPIVEYGDPSNSGSCATVFQEYVSPHFWAHILSPIMKTADCPRVMFLDPKDKVRDMLGFYWGYPEVDKVESMRRSMSASSTQRKSVGAASGSKKGPVKKILPVAKGFIQSEDDLRKLKHLIDTHDTISFDVFDTLIERVVDQPSDIHRLMEKPVLAITNGVLSGFAAARQESRHLALSRAHNEEVLLKDRYSVLVEHHGLPEGLATDLHELELNMEKDVCRPRFLGRFAFDYAKSRKKRIVLVSDTYFDRTFILSLLKQCGYGGWHEMYLSSEEGVLKQTGNLFDHVLKEERYRPEKMLHIGDNPTADIEMARKRGISTYHAPHKAAVAQKLSPMLDAYDVIKDPIAKSLIKGLVSRKLTSGPVPLEAGFTHGNANVLGYTLLGPMFLGFAKWIMDCALEEEITDLYFLARDGEIVKRCFDLLSVGRNDAPRSHYVLASRRSARVAQLYSEEEVLNLIEVNFNPCPLGDLLKNRFGIEAALIKRDVYAKYGFEGPGSLADWRTGKDKLREFIIDAEVLDLILKNAREERDLLVRYYREEGLDSTPGKKIGFVDIGHAGSLQASISRLMKLRCTEGFYFATTYEVDVNLAAGGHGARGFVVDRMSEQEAKHPYRKHLLMFELVFQNTQQSFIRMQKHSDGYEPEYLASQQEARRVRLIRDAHDGVCEFIEDVVADFGARVFHFELGGMEATAAYRKMLEEPRHKDAELFRGVVFENVYSARAMRWIIPPHQHAGDEGLWREGVQVLDEHQQSKARATIPKPVVHLASLFVKNEKKLAKLHCDPERFFRDSRYGIVNLVGKTFLR